MYIYIYINTHTYIYIYGFDFEMDPVVSTLSCGWTFEMAAKPLGTSANFKPADGDK